MACRSIVMISVVFRMTCDTCPGSKPNTWESTSVNTPDAEVLSGWTTVTMPSGRTVHVCPTCAETRGIPTDVVAKVA